MVLENKEMITLASIQRTAKAKTAHAGAKQTLGVHLATVHKNKIKT